MKRIVLFGLVVALLVSFVPWRTGLGRIEASSCQAVHRQTRGNADADCGPLPG